MALLAASTLSSSSLTARPTVAAPHATAASLRPTKVRTTLRVRCTPAPAQLHTTATAVE